jgi:hypothetical protein
MVKLNHLRHPVRTTPTATHLVAARLEMRHIAKQGEQRFGGDKRYNLSAIIEGLFCHIDNSLRIRRFWKESALPIAGQLNGRNPPRASTMPQDGGKKCDNAAWAL